MKKYHNRLFDILGFAHTFLFERPRMSKQTNKKKGESRRFFVVPPEITVWPFSELG